MPPAATLKRSQCGAPVHAHGTSPRLCPALPCSQDRCAFGSSSWLISSTTGTCSNKAHAQHMRCERVMPSAHATHAVTANVPAHCNPDAHLAAAAWMLASQQSRRQTEIETTSPVHAQPKLNPTTTPPTYKILVKGLGPPHHDARTVARCIHPPKRTGAILRRNGAAGCVMSS